MPRESRGKGSGGSATRAEELEEMRLSEKSEGKEAKRTDSARARKEKKKMEGKTERGGEGKKRECWVEGIFFVEGARRVMLKFRLCQ